MATGVMFLWINPCKASVYKGLASIKKDAKENGHSDYRVYMVGNIYNSAKPYKHWVLQAMPLKFIRIVYEIFWKKLWIMTAKKTLKKEEDNAPLIKVLNL